MNSRLPVLLTVTILSLPACSKQTPEDEMTKVTPTATDGSDQKPDGETATESPEAPPQTMVETSGAPAAPSADAVSARVADAEQRLGASSAGKRVWAAIEAQGGLQPWYEAGPLRYRFAYRPLGDRGPTDTYQTVDPWASRARHQLADDQSVEFGWDGTKAWVKPADAELPTNPRFWSLTPYYFVGIPFVLADPGVNLEAMPEAEFEGTTYELVKASFQDGTGDAPGDYYILYIHPETDRVEAIRYVVSYPGFYPDGGHGAEKLMSYDGSQKVGALTFPESYRTFRFDVKSGERGEKVTEISLSDLETNADTPSGHYSPPTDARIITGWK